MNKIFKSIKRDICIILAFALTVTSGFNAVAATDDSSYDSENGFAYDLNYGAFKSASGYIDYFYSDGFFDYDYDGGYCKQLLTLSADAVMAAVPPGNASPSQRDDNIEAFLEGLGFDDFESVDYDVRPTADTNAFSMANKLLKCDEGGVDGKTVISIVNRGAGYGMEWASNLTIGSSGDCTGVSEAADRVVNKLKKYAKDNGLQDELADGDIIFWITGHSRAGAISNLVSKRLADEYGDEGNAVLGYCLSPFMCASSENGTDDAKYASIYSFYSRGEFVAVIPPFGSSDNDEFTLYGNKVEFAIGNDDEVNAELARFVPGRTVSSTVVPKYFKTGSGSTSAMSYRMTSDGKYPVWGYDAAEPIYDIVLDVMCGGKLDTDALFGNALADGETIDSAEANKLLFNSVAERIAPSRYDYAVATNSSVATGSVATGSVIADNVTKEEAMAAAAEFIGDITYLSDNNKLESAQINQMKAAKDEIVGIAIDNALSMLGDVMLLLIDACYWDISFCVDSDPEDDFYDYHSLSELEQVPGESAGVYRFTREAKDNMLAKIWNKLDGMENEEGTKIRDLINGLEYDYKIKNVDRYFITLLDSALAFVSHDLAAQYPTSSISDEIEGKYPGVVLATTIYNFMNKDANFSMFGNHYSEVMLAKARMQDYLYEGDYKRGVDATSIKCGNGTIEIEVDNSSASNDAVSNGEMPVSIILYGKDVYETLATDEELEQIKAGGTLYVTIDVSQKDMDELDEAKRDGVAVKAGNGSIVGCMNIEIFKQLVASGSGNNPSDEDPSDASPSNASPSNATSSNATSSEATSSNASPSEATSSNASPSELTQVYETGMPIGFKITLGEEYRHDNVDYYVIRCHDDASGGDTSYERIDCTYDSATGKVGFSSNLFSEFVLCYAERSTGSSGYRRSYSSGTSRSDGWKYEVTSSESHWAYYKNNERIKNSWALLPVDNSSNAKTGWFRFDENGYMVTGWYKDAVGDWYYLNPVSDGTMGLMQTGLITAQDGKQYYLNTVSDGTMGRLIMQ